MNRTKDKKHIEQELPDHRGETRKERNARIRKATNRYSEKDEWEEEE